MSDRNDHGRGLALNVSQCMVRRRLAIDETNRRIDAAFQQRYGLFRVPLAGYVRTCWERPRVRRLRRLEALTSRLEGMTWHDSVTLDCCRAVSAVVQERPAEAVQLGSQAAPAMLRVSAGAHPPNEQHSPHGVSAATVHG